jgi:predicted metal-dependent enzyme (double-stranded beta helix superfamily)
MTQHTVQTDEWLVDVPPMRHFIEEVNKMRSHEADPRRIVAAVRPHFARLLGDSTWLPAKYQEPAQESGMGRGIGMWLLYRAGDGGLAFSALVLPTGASTPVHDHLAWGLVGLYRGGEQDEEVFRRADDGSQPDHAHLEVTERHRLRPGDFYELLPENDIHRVRTISPFTSVSLHLLGNDNGCIWRHRFEPGQNRVEPFRSGWLNVPCRE